MIHMINVIDVIDVIADMMDMVDRLINLISKHLNFDFTYTGVVRESPFIDSHR